MQRSLIFTLILCLVCKPLFVAAQGTAVSFGTLKANTELPVEVTSESLDVNQGDGSALFEGAVLISQGDMRLSADSVRVINKSEGRGIERLEARGNVVLVSGPDAAESNEADYTVESGEVLMRGNVLVTQGATSISAESMTVDLTTGNAVLSGRVKTILNTGGSD